VLDVSAITEQNKVKYKTTCRLRMSLTSFIPSTVSLWNNLDLNVRNSPNISCFKSRIKEKTVKSPEYYGEGSRKLSKTKVPTPFHSKENLYLQIVFVL
jgi:hypothetical protein